jgi:flagellar basal body-associated protein FliL
MRKNQGVSIIEILIVFAIICIVGAIAITIFIKAGEKENQEKSFAEKASPYKKEEITWNCLGGPSCGGGHCAVVYWAVNPATQDTVYILPNWGGIFVLPAKPVAAESTK